MADTPMKKQGGIILGVGGDNSHRSIGTFYEGVLTAGYSSDEADNAVQANLVGVYGSASSVGLSVIAAAE